jgi:hypothetical protein
MNTPSFHDPRASDLLSRVSEDISLLRQDVGHLLNHTARHTLPTGARELAASARSHLAAGRLRTAEQMRSLREHAGPPAAWVSGAVVVGLLAAGIYWFCKEGCVCRAGDEEEPMD